MKKIVSLIALAIVMLLAVSCTQNSPKSVASEALNCIVKEDWEGLVNLMNYADTEKGKEDKATTLALLKEKTGNMDKEKKMVSFKILTETISEDGESAVVDYESTTAAGKKETKTMKLVKNDKGEWKLNSEK